MKFIVSRTSGGDNAPCENAVLFKMPYTQKCNNCHTFEEYAECHNQKWTDFGENHRINADGIIERTMYATCWYIEISSLEDLVKLQNKCEEELIIHENYLNNEYPEVEIYDAWRG